MKLLRMPTAEAVRRLNQFVCQEGGNLSGCYDLGKIESAIHSAFYPGSYPFAAGGIGAIAAVLCFYIVKSHAFYDGNKRTGVLTAITFLNMHGYDLRYPKNSKTGFDALAEVIEKCAASQISKDDLVEWFEAHKIEIR